MFPMISSMEELRAAKEILEDVRENLIADGVRVDPDIEIGIMVEVPSAVMMIEDFAKESDFFSIGTNDLVQFTLAVDRSNEKISNLFQPHHPSVLKMIRLVCDAAHEAGITVSVCGEMASDPLSIVLLAGLGVDELSMNPWNIIENKNFLHLVDYSEMRQAALESMRMLTATEINSYLYRRFGKRVMESGASSVMTKGQKYQEKAMIRFGDDFVGISSVEK
jgi:phosphotransferase system enzyme I (PtsI)